MAYLDKLSSFKSKLALLVLFLQSASSLWGITANDDSSSVTEGFPSSEFNILNNDDSSKNPVSVSINLDGGDGSESFINGNLLYSVSGSTSSENLSLTMVSSASNSLGEISIADNVIYRGIGGNTEVIGNVDSNLDGLNGNDLLLNMLDPDSFLNGDFSMDDSSSQVSATTEYRFTGWTVLQERIQLDGLSNLLGYPTPADGDDPVNGPSTDNTVISSATYNHAITTSDPSSDGGNALELSLSCSVPGFGIIHGPTLIS